MPLSPGTQDVYERLRAQIATLREEVTALNERLAAIERAQLPPTPEQDLAVAHDALEILLGEIDRLSPDLPSCVTPHCDRLARARAKIDATRVMAVATTTWSSGPTQEPIQPLLRDALNALRENLSSTQTRARAVPGGWVIRVTSGDDEAVATLYTSGKAKTSGPSADLRRNIQTILATLGYKVTD